MKKFISLVLAMTIVLSAFMGLGFSVSAEDTQVLNVTVNDVTTQVPVGEKFTYYYTLSNINIINAEARVNYDSSKLKLTVVDDSDEDLYNAFMEQTFPVVYATVPVYNFDLTDRILYNFSSVKKAYEFTDNTPLTVFEFTALEAGDVTINTDMLEMADENKELIVDKTPQGSVQIKDYVCNEYITYVAPEEPTDAPTDAPTEAPTDAPTEAPTDAPTEAPDPTNVTNISYTSDETTINLTWDEIPNVVMYWIYKYNESTGSWGAPYTSTTTNSALVKKLDPNTTYQFKITFKLNGKITPLAGATVFEASTKEAATVAPEVDKITNLTYNAEATNIKFTWEPIPNAVMYWIYKYNESTGSWGAPQASTTTNSILVRNLEPSTTYKFKITFKKDGKTIPLDDAEVFEATTKEAAAPKDINAAPDATHVTLNWDAVEGATKYWVYKATSPDGPYYIYHSSTTNSMIVRKLKPETDYYFRVTSLTVSNGVNTISAVDHSPTIHVKTLSKDLVTTRVAEVKSDSVTIEWTPHENSDMYWVWISETTNDTTKKDEWKVLKSFTDTSVSEYTYTNLDNAKTYFLTISVRYYTDDGTKMITEYFPVQVMTKYTDGDMLTFEPIDDTTVKVTWDEGIDVERFWLFIYDESGNQVQITSTETNTVTVRKLNDMKNYTYHLRVKDNYGFYGYITADEGEKYHE